MLTLRNVLIGFLLVIAAALSSWSLLFSNHTQNKDAGADSRPDAFMEDVVATTINKDGKPSLKLTTPKMTHYAQGDTTDIISPQLTLYRQSPNPWFINADFAKASQGTDQIDFVSNVMIYHLADLNDPTTTMKTIQLTVLPNQQVAKTKEHVTITQPNTVINATGMLADLNLGSVKLLSEAKGEYVPNS